MEKKQKIKAENKQPDPSTPKSGFRFAQQAQDDKNPISNATLRKFF